MSRRACCAETTIEFWRKKNCFHLGPRVYTKTVRAARTVEALIWYYYYNIKGVERVHARTACRLRPRPTVIISSIISSEFISDAHSFVIIIIYYYYHYYNDGDLCISTSCRYTVDGTIMTRICWGAARVIITILKYTYRHIVIANRCGERRVENINSSHEYFFFYYYHRY